jgi:hypothetical protein
LANGDALTRTSSVRRIKNHEGVAVKRARGRGGLRPIESFIFSHVSRPKGHEQKMDAFQVSGLLIDSLNEVDGLLIDALNEVDGLLIDAFEV